MDGNNWRAAPGHVQIPGQVMGVDPVPTAGMEGGDWRSQLQQDSRQRIVNKIMDTLKRHLPYSGPEGLQELKKIAVRFEEKIYVAATSQSDYLRKISLKMLTMETKSQSPIADSSQPGAGSNSQDPASQSMQPQMQNQVQQLSMPVVSNQSQVRQQMMSQNLHNNIALNGVPNSAGLPSALPAMSGTMPNVPGSNASIQNMQILPNMAANSIGQGMPPNSYANPQRQIQGRQQPGATQDQVQQPQGSHQYAFNQQLFMKQKFQQGGIPQQQSIMQSQTPQQQQQHQQNLMQPNQLQSSQQVVMQSALRQTSSPSSSSSSTLQNQQSSLQHSTQTMLQQPSQSVLRQQQPQAPNMQQQQQQNAISQHSIMSSQQQQLHNAQHLNAENIQPNQLIGQHGTTVDAQQQQRMIVQQNSMSNMQHQQQQTVSKQNNLPSLHQQQSATQQNNLSSVHQQQLGSQNNPSGFQQQQMQMQSSMLNMLSNQTQSQSAQHQLMPQMQSQSGQLQQQLGLQQHTNNLPRDMQQRVQTSGSLIQQSNIDQKPIIQPQRVVDSQLNAASLDPSSQIGNANGGDWQEEIYQKIKSMHDMYYPELSEKYQKMTIKLQQHESIPQAQKNDQLDKLNFFKMMLERLLVFLRMSKNDIQPAHKDKVFQVEKQITHILNTNRTQKPLSMIQKGQLAQPQMISVQQPQISQMHSNEGQMNSQMQSLNGQASVVNNVSNLQHGSLSSSSTFSNSRQGMMDAMQPGSNIDNGEGSALNQMQQVAMNSLQQNPVNGPQQMNITSMASQSGMATLASAVNPLQGNSNMLQGPQIKQEPQSFPNQQLKQQYQQRQMLMHRQQMMQQQQQQQPQLQSHQQGVQMPSQQMSHLNQMNDVTDVKMRQQMTGKNGTLQSHQASQRSSYHHQSFSVSSQQALQAASPQIPHHSSPQMEQQNIMSSHAKAGTPLQSSNSPFVAPSPSTSVAPSPIPGDSEKIVPGVTSQPNVPPMAAASLQNQSLAIGTPGISASPLLAEFTNADGTHGVLSSIVPGTSNAVDRPLDRLIKAVKSLSPTALSSSINDISSVVSLTDRIAGSAPGNGSRAAMGEDLVAMTKCRLQARNFFSKDGSNCSKKMRRYTTAMTSNIIPFTGNVNESFRSASGDDSCTVSSEVPPVKRPRLEANHVLEEELRDINMGLIDTVVHISDDVDPTAVDTAGECAEGTVVKCTFSAVALGPNLKSQFASAQMSPIQPLRLLVPKDYPNCSPVLLDKFPIEVSKEYESLSMRTKSRFSISLRTLAQPMSLADIARTWDKCARTVISEFAQMSGGGTFSSKYGKWEKCITAA